MPKEVDILKHKLVPKHRILTKEEEKELLERYGITKKDLPKILDSDPVIKKIGAKIGDIVEITRKDIQKSKYYRVVVKSK